MLIIKIIEISSAVLLTITILLQNKGAGMGSAFGGDNGVTRSKRGAEKGLFVITIILAIIFLASALANFIF